MGSTYGKVLKISIFGESHGEVIGAVIDGFPEGIAIDDAFISAEMARRAPGGPLSTNRNESDQVKIVSGILGEFSTGAPICGIIENSDTRSKDYDKFRNVPRPSHADYTGGLRYKGYNDPRGSGHFSGRLTAPLVFCGALCKLYLRSKGIEIGSHFRSIGDASEKSLIEYPQDWVNVQLFKTLRGKELSFIEDDSMKKAIHNINEAREDLDSIGGQVECAILGVEPGYANPMMETIESRIAALAFSVPAVKGIEFGAGFAFSGKKGSEANDCYIIEEGKVKLETNNNGGCLGGISNGAPIIFNVVFKPTPSIGKPQETLNLFTEEMEALEIKGRHDPCIAVRGLPVIEAIAAIAISDIIIEGCGYAGKS